MIGHCSIGGCEKHGTLRRGMCGIHYTRFIAHGDALYVPPKHGAALRYYREVVLTYVGDDCLTWPFASVKGYGTVGIDGKTKYVSRLACEHRNGKPPTPKHEAAHSCGNGHLKCVNQMHVGWKTKSGNNIDREIHNNGLVRGTKSRFAKLNEEKVLEILSLKGKMYQREIAEKFGISSSAIQKIHNGENWAWLQANDNHEQLKATA